MSVIWRELARIDANLTRTGAKLTRTGANLTRNDANWRELKRKKEKKEKKQKQKISAFKLFWAQLEFVIFYSYDTPAGSKKCALIAVSLVRSGITPHSNIRDLAWEFDRTFEQRSNQGLPRSEICFFKRHSFF